MGCNVVKASGARGNSVVRTPKSHKSLTPRVSYLQVGASNLK